MGLALAACGSGAVDVGGAGPGVGEGLSFGAPAGQPPTVAAYDAATDSFTVAVGPTVVGTFTPYPWLDRSGFRGYASVHGADVLYASVSPTGSVTARLGAGEGSAGPSFRAGEFTRVAGAPPASGTAIFVGGYVAITQARDTGDIGLSLAGDVQLVADFGTATISGLISNRYGFDISGPPPVFQPLFTFGGDVVLVATAIDPTGGFGGVASGGAILISKGGSLVSASATSNGSYRGIIGGQDGADVAGGVIIDHVQNGNAFQEVGVFIAGQ